MLARVLQLSLGLAVGLGASGCSDYRYIGTDGVAIPGGAVFEEKPASWVIVQSAKHDIPCDAPVLTGEGSLERDWVVEGCGERLTYRFFAWAGHMWQPELLARVTTCGGPHPAVAEPCSDDSAASAR